MAYLLNARSPSDVANFVRQQNIPAVPVLSGLSGRPNRAIEYGHYNVLAVLPVPHMNGFFDEATVNTKLLIGGVAILAAGLYLMGRKHARRRRRMRTFRRRILS